MITFSTALADQRIAERHLDAQAAARAADVRPGRRQRLRRARIAARRPERAPAACR